MKYQVAALALASALVAAGVAAKAGSFSSSGSTSSGSGSSAGTSGGGSYGVVVNRESGAPSPVIAPRGAQEGAFDQASFSHTGSPFGSVGAQIEDDPSSFKAQSDYTPHNTEYAEIQDRGRNYDNPGPLLRSNDGVVTPQGSSPGVSLGDSTRTTGAAATPITNSPLPASPVPEADAWVMLIAGLGVIGAKLSRRQSQA